MNSLVALAIAIILILAAVAVYLNWRVYRVKTQQKAKEREAEQKYADFRERANDSIQIVCRAYLQGQVETGEACLRICGLMDQLNVPPQERTQYTHIAKMSDAIRHIPILEAWQALPKKEKKEHQEFMSRKAAELEQGIKQDVQRLAGQTF